MAYRKILPSLDRKAYTSSDSKEKFLVSTEKKDGRETSRFN